MRRGAPFIGRMPELVALEEMIVPGRVVTVTGTGGCGKTRVALEVASRIGARRELEVVPVDVGTLAGTQQVIGAVLGALGGRERGGKSPLEVVIEALDGPRILLVLDDCEHLSAEIRDLSARLLDAAPELHVLATSREPLGVRGELVLQLGPLSLPDPEGDVAAVVRSDAGTLFVDRAVATNPDFTLTPSAARAVARLCHELDGLPLALTLAAGQARTMALGEVADGLLRQARLSGAPDGQVASRHRSLRASLDWSYRLLQEEERRLLRRLSVFAGGSTVAAAHSVALPETSEHQVRELLDVLEAKGLIVAVPAKGAARWTLLRTVQHYAAERLDRDGEREQTEKRHLAWACALAAEADRSLIAPSIHELVDEESQNLRLALARAIEVDAPSALHLAAALSRHWILAEHFEEGAASCAAVLAVATADGDVGAQAMVQSGAGVVAMLREDYPAAVSRAETAAGMLADVDDPEVRGRCLSLIGLVMMLTGIDLGQALASVSEAVELLRASDDRLGLAWSLVNLAIAGGLCDQFDVARAAYDEFLALPGGPAHARLRTWAELGAAWTEALVGSPERALAHADLSLELDTGSPSMTHFQAAAHRTLALAWLGRTEEALDYGAREIQLAEAYGSPQAVPGMELALAVAQFMHGDLESAASRAKRLARRAPQVHTLALIHEVLARIALCESDPGEAERQADALDELAERTCSLRHRAVARLVRGRAAVMAGDPVRGRDLLQAALMNHVELRLERGAAEALDELGLLGEGGDARRAARLAGAAAATRARLSCAPLPSSLCRLEAARRRFAQCDGSADWSAGWEEGEALSLEEAVAYVRRARGPRGRPLGGWASLTPTELDVARLATSGLSNPQIASQLFMSRSTVKTHLSSVFFKLGVANRTELARELAAVDDR